MGQTLDEFNAFDIFQGEHNGRPSKVMVRAKIKLNRLDNEPLMYEAFESLLTHHFCFVNVLYCHSNLLIVGAPLRTSHLSKHNNSKMLFEEADRRMSSTIACLIRKRFYKLKSFEYLDLDEFLTHPCEDIRKLGILLRSSESNLNTNMKENQDVTLQCRDCIEDHCFRIRSAGG